MASNLTPPGPLRLQGNIDNNWRLFKQTFSNYLAGSDLTGKSDAIKIGILLSCLGSDCIEIFNSFQYENDGEDKQFDIVMKKFEEYCVPKTNIVFERHVFFSKLQDPSEGTEAFVTTLNNLSASCEFGGLREELVLAQLVRGVKDEAVRMRLLREEKLTLKKAVEMCRVSEISEAQAKTFTPQASASVALVRNPKNKKPQKSQQKFHQAKPQQTQQPTTTDNSFTCSRCGLAHPKNKCPAYGQECAYCHKIGHWKKFCRKRNRNINVVEEQSTETGSFFVGHITKQGSSSAEDDWKITVQVQNEPLTLKIDTGADCNVLCINKLKSVTSGQMKPHSGILESFSGHKLKPVGKETLNIKFKGKEYPLTFVIVNENVPSILGRAAAVQMGVVKRVLSADAHNAMESFKEEFPQVFKGVGKLPYTYSIDVDPSVAPKINPPRPVPHALKNQVKEELDRMEKSEIIQRVEEHTPWVSNMVTVIKPNKIRLCIDPTQLNTAIRREHYPLRTVEEVISQMSNAKYFAKYDAAQGFYQISLDESSSRLCTFATPFGRYKFNRLPFGIKSAPEIYQRVMDQIIEGMPNTHVIMDDVVQCAESMEQLYELARMFLKKCADVNLTLNPKKCEFGLTSLTYVGHVLTSEGVKPDPEKVKSIVEMPPPDSKEAVKSFLGTITYLSKFIPNLSQESAPLRQLLSKDSVFFWDKAQQESFDKLKTLISQDITLSYYDGNKPSVLSVDASSYGIGAVLIQEEKPIAFASKSLSSCQQAYAQIEKEALAIQFGCSKFHQYLYGTKFIVESDHRPLEAIFKKPINSSPPRLQSLRLKLACYDMIVQYKPGKSLVLADQLSRMPIKEIFEDNMEVALCCAIKVNRIEMRAETAKDQTLKQVMKFIRDGWPKDVNSVSKEVKVFFSFRDELSVYDGVIFKAEKLVIPESLRESILDELHYPHLGITLTQQRAREAVYWPGMAKDIEKKVETCIVCQESQFNNTKEPLMSTVAPDRPWSYVAADLCEILHVHYLVVVDHFSGFIEVECLNNNTTTQSVVSHLKSQFARHGIPDILMTDNGPQFTAAQFQEFVSTYGFEHITSSPYKHNSNGLAEKAVQTVKHLLTKAKKDNKDPYLALLAYRATPRSSSISSPAQRLFSRNVKTRLPTAPSLLKPSISKNVQQELNAARKRQSTYYNRSAKDLPSVRQGQAVLFRDRGHEGQWRAGKITRPCPEPRSYEIQGENGGTYRRNRQHITPLRAAVSSNNSSSVQNVPLSVQNVPSSVQSACSPALANRPKRSVHLPKKLEDFVL